MLGTSDEKGKRRKEKGDCEADERKRINSHAGTAKLMSVSE